MTVSEGKIQNLSQCIIALIILSLIVKMCLINLKKVVTFALSLTLCSFSFYFYKTQLEHTRDKGVLFLKLCESARKVFFRRRI